VTGIGPFTHVSMYQSAIAVSDILGQAHATADYRALPRVTFTDPEIGSVGLGEHEARERGIRVGVGTTQVPSTTRGWIHKAGNAGFIKLIADLDNEVLVGATSAGPIGGEVLGLLTLAIHARVPLSSLRSMIYAYPTFHRGSKRRSPTSRTEALGWAPQGARSPVDGLLTRGPAASTPC